MTATHTPLSLNDAKRIFSITYFNGNRVKTDIQGLLMISPIKSFKQSPVFKWIQKKRNIKGLKYNLILLKNC